MKRWTTSNGIVLTRVLFGRCNSFLISSGGNHVLVDNGQTNKLKALKKHLGALGVTPENLNLMILTHTHFDHAENSAEMVREYRPVLLVHEEEAEFLATGDSPMPDGTNWFSRLLINSIGRKLQHLFKYKPVKAEVTVNEKYDLAGYGINGYILPTPGHTTGSISLIVDNEIAIVGDAMFGIFPGKIFPPFANDVPAMIQSWKTLLDTGCSLFLPAHGRERSRKTVEREYLSRITSHSSLNFI
ncbi:MAG: MBL fold metallo-hydrolase [Spirochaetota bacterium]